MFSSPLSALLMENETFTRSHHPKAHMHSGSVQGLFWFVSKPNDKTSAGTGYRHIYRVQRTLPRRRLDEDGLVHTIEWGEMPIMPRLFFSVPHLLARSAFMSGCLTVDPANPRRLGFGVHRCR